MTFYLYKGVSERKNQVYVQSTQDYPKNMKAEKDPLDYKTPLSLQIIEFLGWISIPVGVLVGLREPVIGISCIGSGITFLMIANLVGTHLKQQGITNLLLRELIVKMNRQ